MADYTPVTWNTGDTATATQFTALSAALDEEETLNDIQDAACDKLTGQIATVHRMMVVANSLSATSGTVNFVYFTADQNMTVSNFSIRTGGTAAAATPTLIRMGLYSESVVGDLTLIGSTPNDTSLFSSTLTMYTKALSTPVDITMGNRYAFALLQVSAVAVATISGSNVQVGSSESAQSPRLFCILASQTDLPSSVVFNNLALGGSHYYVRLS